RAVAQSRRRLAGRSRLDAVGVELGHDAGTDGGADRRPARHASAGDFAGSARRGGMTAQSGAAGRDGRYDYLIVGAGFAGSVLAERLASQHGARVLLIDRRPHVGGNAYDEPNAAGILYHKYGPHIFHTNSDAVVDYLSQFTEWRPYEHRVRAV